MGITIQPNDEYQNKSNLQSIRQNILDVSADALAAYDDLPAGVKSLVQTVLADPTSYSNDALSLARVAFAMSLQNSIAVGYFVRKLDKILEDNG